MAIFWKEIRMSDLSVNQAKVKQDFQQETPVETGGVIASNLPSPLFTPAVETGGSIASNSASSSSGGSVSFTC